MNPNMTDATLIEHDNVKQFVLFMNSMEPELLTHNSCRWRITNSKEFVIAFRGKVNTVELNFGDGNIIRYILRDNYTDGCVASGSISDHATHDWCVYFIENLLQFKDVETTTDEFTTKMLDTMDEYSE